jgi:hypothetical protein
VLARAVGRDQHERQTNGQGGQRHVDEEHRLPAQRLGQQAAQEHPDHQPGRPGAAPDGHCTVALAALRERRVDQ